MKELVGVVSFPLEIDKCSGFNNCFEFRNFKKSFLILFVKSTVSNIF